MGIDVAALDIRHVRLDKDDRYEKDMDSGLNYCFKVKPNLDQGPRQFKQDAAMSMFDQGVIAIVPVDTTFDPNNSGSFDIKSLRIGRIVGWRPHKVRVEVYNENSGRREEVTLDKDFVAIAENPLYSVMNEPNSTLQRLIRKLNLLDAVDEQSSSGKLDMIIQLPYVIKSESRRKQAEQRRKDIEYQLKGSQYGIAYTDGTERITQLNRPAENNLLHQVEFLTKMLYSQLGLTESVMDGTADEKAMLNYYNRTIEPILESILEAMRRTFLTKTAQSQGQWILAFRDPFKLVPVTEIAEIADKFTRNEITSANEIRQAIGLKPSKDPKADELR
ncbi:MAG TPA: phage portal protein, partial [Nitrospira sp.]|nr:phage portal protein [Nitrospira sp.]